MSHIAVVSVPFSLSCHAVYEALCDLGRYPEWNTGMTEISFTGRMHPGLRYTTRAQVLGRVAKSEVIVKEMVPDERILLSNKSGIVKFEAVFELEPLSADTCNLVCKLQFSFSQAVFNLAQPVIEAVAEAHIRDDLQMLRATLQADAS